nr:hypothetical protein [Tanacetum cinerariifolium]
MAESSSPDITPKEEPVTLDRPESPNPFLPAIQCLGEKIGGLDQISNKDATILYCLANGVQVDYAKIIWEDLIHKLNKKTREKIVPYPRFIALLLEHMAPKYDNEELTINPTQVFNVHNWILKLNQPEEPLFTDHMKAIYNLDVPVDSKATKYSSLTEESSSAMDISPSHPSPPTPMVGKMHKETQQAAGGLTSLGDTNKDGVYSQLSSGSNPSVLVDKTKSAGNGLKITHTTSSANEESKADDSSRNVKLEDLADILKDTRSAFFTPDSPTDEPIIVSDVLELKNIQWELPAEFLDLPQLAFTTLVENASGATTMDVPSADKAITSPAEREADADTNLKMN